jgi:hypothetical protein
MRTSNVSPRLSFLISRIEEEFPDVLHLDARKPSFNRRKFMNFRTDGLDIEFVKELVGADISSSCGSMEPLLGGLAILEMFSHDYDFSVDFAERGSHLFLKRLLMHEDENVSVAAERVVSAITSSGCGFPLKKVMNARNDTDGSRPPFLDFIERSGTDKDAPGLDEALRVYLRSVPQEMYGAGQHAVGYILWSSAVVLSRLIVSNRLLIKGKTVLEIGAGLGLCGVIAGRYATRVTISDYYNEQILRNIEANIGKLLRMYVPICKYKY